MNGWMAAAVALLCGLPGRGWVIWKHPPIDGLAALELASSIVVVTCRDPLRQTILLSLYGLVLAVLFMSFQAPDVALSELVVGSVIIPLVVLLTLAKVRGRAE